MEQSKSGKVAARNSSRFRDALFRYVPALDSLRTYSGTDFQFDLMAGLTVAAVAVPQAMAYAQVAGLPPQYGLYTAIVMTAVGALLDSSKQLINGPTNAISIAVLSALVAIPEGDKIAAVFLLALMVGVIQTGISLLRLGDLSKYVSHSVIVGFTLGAGILIVLDQLKNLLGLPARGSGDDVFLKRFWLTISNIDAINMTTLLIGLGTIGVALLLRAINAKWRVRLPELLLAIISTTVVVAYWNLDARGVAIVKDIPAKLPSFQWPIVNWQHVRSLSSGALAIALLGLLEAIAMAKAIAAVTKQKLDINQQCLSEGVANLTGSFFQCIPGSGSLTRSNINQQAGGRTQWSGVISAVALAFTVILFARYAYYIPKAGLAGILMLSAWRLVDRKQLEYYVRTTRFDAWIVAITAIAAVAVSVEFCVLIGVFMSFVLYVPRAARAHLTELVMTANNIIREREKSDVPCRRIRIFSLEGEFFFGAAPELEQHLDHIAATVDEGARVVILRLKRVRNPDAVCMSVLDHFIDKMQAAGVSVLFCGVRPDLMHVIETSGLARRIGPERLFVFEERTKKYWTSAFEAVQFAYTILGDDLCETCPRRAETAGQEGKERNDWYYLI